jgi:murein DD-endopeptidase MepM/ murein hydrolase activator NlpD
MKFAFAAFACLLASSPARLVACDTGSQLEHPVQGEIYAKFGYDIHTVRFHSGLDYRGAAGDPVVAAETGTVAAAGRYGGYGNYIRIDHGNGLQTAYNHLLNYKVKPGQCVGKGEVIGSVGNSGYSSGPHLHFEVLRDDKVVDPCALLPDRSGCQPRNTLHDCRGPDCELVRAIQD